MSPTDEGTDYARLAARALASEDQAAAPTGLGDRPADLAAIERALRSRARRRRSLTWPVVAGITAVAAAAALVAWSKPRLAPVAHAERPAAQAERPAAQPAPAPAMLSIAALGGDGASIALAGGARQAIAGDEVAPGAWLHVPRAGTVTLAVATGTRLDLAGGAAAKVAELGAVQRFDLAAGSLAAKVAKLAPGHRFLIGTPDAEVEVRGTRFEVTVAAEPAACGPRVRTRVTVQEGVVVVTHAGDQIRVEAGGHWPDCQPASATPASSRHVPARTAQPGAHPHVALERPPAPTPELLRASTLAEQNDLFAAALAASRRGDVDEAVHWLDRLIARHPTGQLTDSARAERRRLTEAGIQRAPRD
jgi:hypothetical protein